MDLNKLYVIPERDCIDEYLAIVSKYGMHFEYNDFFLPMQLADEESIQSNIDFYRSLKNLPEGNTMHGSFLDVTVFSSDPMIRDISEFRVRQSMDIASRIGARAVIFHTNYIANFNDEMYENNWVNINADFYSKILDEYPDISVYMENMFDMSPGLIKMLAEKMAYHPRFGICLDYAHVNVFGMIPDEEWLKELAPYIKHVHINDNNLITDSHLALGQGKIDYQRFFELYEKYIPDATVLLEMKGLEKIRESLKYMNIE